jgi:hypothetical protein
VEPAHLDTLGDVMRAARAAALAHARALRPDTPPVEAPREASPTWLVNITCTYCGAPLELDIPPVAGGCLDLPTWDTLTNAACSNTRCAQPFDIQMRLRPRAPKTHRGPRHTRDYAASGAALIDTITATS